MEAAYRIGVAAAYSMKATTPLTTRTRKVLAAYNGRRRITAAISKAKPNAPLLISKP